MPASKSGTWAHPKHGTMTGYANYGCRCSLCRAKNASTHRKWTSNHRQHTRNKARHYYALHPDRRRIQTLRRYGLSPEAFDALLLKQLGACAICGTTGEQLDVDHDHRCCPTEKSCGRCIRGLLCQRCNKGIGLFAEDHLRLVQALTYLKTWRPVDVRD